MRLLEQSITKNLGRAFLIYGLFHLLWVFVAIMRRDLDLLIYSFAAVVFFIYVRDIFLSKRVRARRTA